MPKIGEELAKEKKRINFRIQTDLKSNSLHCFIDICVIFLYHRFSLIWFLSILMNVLLNLLKSKCIKFAH